jgi:hypothetical protein
MDSVYSLPPSRATPSGVAAIPTDAYGRNLGGQGHVPRDMHDRRIDETVRPHTSPPPQPSMFQPSNCGSSFNCRQPSGLPLQQLHDFNPKQRPNHPGGMGAEFSLTFQLLRGCNNCRYSYRAPEYSFTIHHTLRSVAIPNDHPICSQHGVGRSSLQVCS